MRHHLRRIDVVCAEKAGTRVAGSFWGNGEDCVSCYSCFSYFDRRHEKQRTDQPASRKGLLERILQMREAISFSAFLFSPLLPLLLLLLLLLLFLFLSWHALILFSAGSEGFRSSGVFPPAFGGNEPAGLSYLELV